MMIPVLGFETDAPVPKNWLCDQMHVN